MKTAILGMKTKRSPLIKNKIPRIKPKMFSVKKKYANGIIVIKIPTKERIGGNTQAGDCNTLQKVSKIKEAIPNSLTSTPVLIDIPVIIPGIKKRE